MAQENKFLTFKLGDESYGFPILMVKEIIGMMNITKVPKVPKFIKGVINLRGQILPVIDIRIKFDLQERDYDERTSIIIMEVETANGTKTNGIVVDTVQEVLDIPQDSIEEPPKYGVNVSQAFMTGIGKVKEDVIILLDVNKVFTEDEKEILETVK